MKSASAVVDDELVARVKAGQLPLPRTRKRIRQEANLSLREMASSLKVTPMTLLRWEAGECTPRLDNAIAYRQLLDALDMGSTS